MLWFYVKRNSGFTLLLAATISIVHTQAVTQAHRSQHRPLRGPRASPSAFRLYLNSIHLKRCSSVIISSSHHLLTSALKHIIRSTVYGRKTRCSCWRRSRSWLASTLVPRLARLSRSARATSTRRTHSFSIRRALRLNYRVIYISRHCLPTNAMCLCEDDEFLAHEPNMKLWIDHYINTRAICSGTAYFCILWIYSRITSIQLLYLVSFNLAQSIFLNLGSKICMYEW